MPDFEPPKYISSLIPAINDAAKAAQTSALAMSAVGLFLIATAISSTDEDLLLEYTVSIAQLGVQIPVFSFAIVPAVFVALHCLTLIRYDLLSVNARQLRAELDEIVSSEHDRERCRQLLANVEFIVARTAPVNSPLYSRLFLGIAYLTVVLLPLVTLLLVQLSSLRYQSAVVNWAERGAWLEAAGDNAAIVRGVLEDRKFPLPN